ncbi:MAG: polysaccharide pyruvyl transferase family protein [Nibricoccus sp.]
MKIGILGTPVSSGNRGVLALGASLVNLCAEAAPGCHIALLLGNQDNRPATFRVGGKETPIEVVNVRMSPRARPRDHLFWILGMSMLYRLAPLKAVRAAIARSTPWIKTIVDAKLVGNVHGGDSFSDIYGLKGFIYTFLLDWSVLLVKGTMVQFPQTYGPFKSAVARGLARYLLRRSSVVIARDKQSRVVAQNLVGPGKEVLLSPDVAFSLEAVPTSEIALDPPLAGSVPAGVIGLNVNGLMYNGGYTRNNMFGLKLSYAEFLPELVTRLLNEHPGELWLVPHTFAPAGDVESDQEASRKLRDAVPAALRQRIRIVDREYDQYAIKGIIGRCDFFIGSRMHACIAALSQGVPCIGVAYSMKFAGVFESVGMQDWVIDGRSSDNASAVTRAVELYRLRAAARAGLAEASKDARRKLADIFQRLVSSS